MHDSNNLDCSERSFNQFFVKNVTVTDYTYQFVLKPLIADYVTEDFKYQLVTIELQDDNTIFYDMRDTDKVSGFSDKELRGSRKPLSEEGRKIKLWDVLEYLDPPALFCFGIRLPKVNEDD